MTDEEKKYQKLIKDLNNLPKVETPKNFETDLWRKINSKGVLEKKNFWKNLFSPFKLIPAAAVVTAIIIFFLVDTNSEPSDDPLNAMPRLREDVVTVEAAKDEVFEQSGKAEKKQSILKEKKEGEIRRDKSMDLDLKKKNQAGLQREQNLLTDGMSAPKPQAESLKAEIQAELSAGSTFPAATTYSEPVLEKQNFNFRQINLSEEQKKEVEQLKQKIQTKETAKSKQN